MELLAEEIKERDSIKFNREETLKKIHELKEKGVKVPLDKMIKSEDEIKGIYEASIANKRVLDAVECQIRPFMSTYEIDEIVRITTEELGGTCAPYNYEGYPMHTCTSVNDQVCHGIPSKRDILKPGDIVNVDCTTEYNGYFGDASRMYIIGGKTDKKTETLVRVTKECLDKAFESIIPWKTTLGDIGYIINKLAVSHGFQVVREVGGHGVGLELHEDPYVCHVGKKGEDILITPGMVFTIEPMINAGRRHVFLDASNDWTIYTQDGSMSAQWEYTIAILDDGAHVYSR
jgi:methionyl aminopeptidase